MEASAVRNKSIVIRPPEQIAARLAKEDYFRKGYESYIKNQAFDYDIPNMNDAISYERGRAFAIWSLQTKAPRAVWRQVVAAKTVQFRLAQAFRARVVF